MISHLTLQKRTYFVYSALKVPSILHCCCWYDDCRNKCDLYSDGCCEV